MGIGYIENSLLIKGIAVVLILTATSMIGLTLSIKLKNRSSQLRHLIQAFSDLGTRVNFYMEPIGKAVKMTGENCEGVASQVFHETAVGMETEQLEFSQSWMQAIKKNLSDSDLTRSDISLLASFPELVGNLTFQTGFDDMIAKLKQQEKEADTVWKKEGNSYKLVGFMSGLVIVLIFM